MLRAMRAIQRRVLFWQGIPRAPESEESLAALLARREAVRSTQTAPAAAEPKPDLFRPAKPVTEPLPGMESSEAPPIQTPSAPASSQPPKESEPGATTTSRLLEAKRRAQKRKP